MKRRRSLSVFEERLVRKIFGLENARKIRGLKKLHNEEL
jgi:hypothetical protein